MAEFETTVPSGRSRSETFAYLADFRTVAQWDPSVESAVLTSGSAGSAGATYEVTFAAAGTTTTLPYEAIEVSEPGRIVLRAEIDSMISLDTITVSEESGRVSVHYLAELDLKGARKLAEPLASLGLNRAGKKAQACLTAMLAR